MRVLSRGDEIFDIGGSKDPPSAERRNPLLRRVPKAAKPRELRNPKRTATVNAVHVSSFTRKRLIFFWNKAKYGNASRAVTRGVFSYRVLFRALSRASCKTR